MNDVITILKNKFHDLKILQRNREKRVCAHENTDACSTSENVLDLHTPK